jgi:hypothetical protein
VGINSSLVTGRQTGSSALLVWVRARARGGVLEGWGYDGSRLSSAKRERERREKKGNERERQGVHHCSTLYDGRETAENRFFVCLHFLLFTRTTQTVHCISACFTTDTVVID